MMKQLGIILWLFVFQSVLSGQNLSDADLQYLNKQIRFYNETIHRMVIVFQVFENYNSEITRHINLPKNEGLNNTSSHLPENLFADNSLVRTEDSPLQLYSELQSDAHKSQFSINSSSLVNEVRRIIDFLNEDRRNLDDIIENEDLEIFGNIATIYREIEEAIDYFDKVRDNVKLFEKVIKQHYYSLNLSNQEMQVYSALTDLHFDIKKITRQLRNENQSGIINGISKIEKELNWVRKCISELNDEVQERELNSILVNVDDILITFKKYVNASPPPSAYRAYGRGYFYHNYEVLPKINQYGSGYVWKLEQFFEEYDWKVINYFEEPHYLKVVYAEQIPLEMLRDPTIDLSSNIRTLITENELPEIQNLVVEKPSNPREEMIQPVEEMVVNEEPVELEYTIVETKTIRPDSAHFRLFLVDHLRKDGDRISININGEWVEERISLERNAKTINLEIDPLKENYIILRADNEGWMPPNTIRIKYISRDGSESVIIKRDLKTSEAIQIKYAN